MAELSMRPLSVGEVLDRSFGLLRTRFGALFLVGLACFIVPVFLLVMSLADFAQLAQLSSGAAPGAPQVDLLLRMFGRFAWVGLVAFAAFVVARGAWVHIVSETILGHDSGGGAGTALRRGLATALPMAGLSLLEGAIFFGIYLALAIPMALIIPTMFRGASGGAVALVGVMVLGALALVLWIYVGFYVAVPALVLDSPTRIFGALEHSWSLCRGRRGAILLIIFVLAVFGLIVQLGVTFGLGAIGSTAAPGPQAMGPIALLSFGITALFQIVLGILGYVIQTVMYYDLRVRKEGLDLELVAQSLGEG